MVIRRNKSTLTKSTPTKANPPKSTPAKSSAGKATANTQTPLKRKQEAVGGTTKKFKYELSNLEEELEKVHSGHQPSIVLSMGSGDTGQLGLGEDILERKRPSEISNLNDIVTIRAGGMHSVCLSKTGKVFTFGCNDEGALGRVIVEDEEATVPGLVEFPDSVFVKDITAGDNHSSILTVDGKVYIWGSFRDNNGLIGLLKPFEKLLKPTLIPLDKKIIKIASGENHFAMLTESGDILTFGCAEQGQLGRVSPNNLVRGGRGGLQPLLTPVTVRVKHGVKFCELWAGAFCTVGKSITGDVYGCGLNNYKQLGLKEELLQLMMTNLTEFNEIGDSWEKFSFGQHHTVALTESKKVYIIGRGEYGSLGQGNNEHLTKVTRVELGSDNILTVAACNRTSYALMDDGVLYSWGMGSSYQLGHGDDEDVNVPTKMTGKQITEKKVIDISPGFQHVLFRAVPRTETDKKTCEIVQKESNGQCVLNNVEVEKKTDNVEDVSVIPMDTNNSGQPDNVSHEIPTIVEENEVIPEVPCETKDENMAVVEEPTNQTETVLESHKDVDGETNSHTNGAETKPEEESCVSEVITNEALITKELATEPVVDNGNGINDVNEMEAEKMEVDQNPDC